METEILKDILEQIFSSKRTLSKTKEALKSPERQHFFVRYNSRNFSQSPLCRINPYALERITSKYPNLKSEEALKDLSPIYSNAINYASNNCPLINEEEGIILFRLCKYSIPKELKQLFRKSGKHPSIALDIGQPSDYIMLNLLQHKGRKPLLVSINTVSENENSAHLLILEQKVRTMTPEELSLAITANTLATITNNSEEINLYRQWTGLIDILEKQFSLRT